MAEPVRQALGEGVAVSRFADELAVVECLGIELGWRFRTGAHPGSAVLWDGQCWEVTDRREGVAGSRWILKPWPDSDTMRDVHRLDAAAVAAAVASAAADRGHRRRRLAAAPIAPLLGFLPGDIQERWRLEWGFPAGVAVAVSSVLELMAGGFGLLQGLLVAFGGEWLLPPWLRWLAVVGPLLLVEGLVRLNRLVFSGEASGTLLLAPIGNTRRRAARRRAERAVAPPKPGIRPWQSVLASTLRTAYASLARREFQERWAEQLEIRAGWLTVLGAGTELIGGTVNLARHGGEGTPLVWLDWFFVVEGVVRLLLLAATGRPVGSLLAVPLEPLVEGRDRD